jgi:hypothetical protein
MGWAKFDDRRHTNTKLIAAGLAANGLDANGITYCAANETDGFIAENVLPLLAPTNSKRQRADIVSKLVAYGRWTRDDDRGGWWVHGFLNYHPSRIDQEKKREADRLRKRAEAQTVPRDTDGRFVPVGFQPESNGSPDGFRADSTAPIPSHPDPSPPGPREPSNSVVNSGVVGEGATQLGEGGKLREVVVHLAGVCKGENREAVMREAALVVGLCAPHTPLSLIDRAVTIIAPKHPVLPRYALKQIETQRRLAGLPAVRLSLDGIIKKADAS